MEDQASEWKNWEGLLDEVQGWLLAQLSCRGRTLIINNLVSSTLWHRLVCVKLPKGLLKEVQKSLLDFFWDVLHWLRQGVPYLPQEEEGGQGLIDITSRVAAFRLQSVLRLLYGPESLP